MKKIINISALALLLSIAVSCSKDFLEITPKGSDYLENNYYKTPEQAFEGLVAAYDMLGAECSGTYSNRLGPLNAASDDCYAGGGGPSDVPAWQVWNNYTLDPANGVQLDFWTQRYKGIYRVNVLLLKLPNAGLDPATLTRYSAECKFLRAFYYFDLIRLFGNIPLILEPLGGDNMRTITQALQSDVWLQIEKDLKESIPDLPEVVTSDENGRITKYAAEALLGRVIIFQGDDTRMPEAASYLAEVNNSPYYHLLPNFGDVFSASNKFNAESVFEITHTNKQLAGWDRWPNFDGNVYTQMIGPRAYVGPIYKVGWGFNPVIKEFAEAFKKDPRYKYSINNIDSLEKAGFCTYEKGFQNTGYFVAKYAPLAENYSTIGGDPFINYPNNVIEIRLADVYLLEAEALVRGGGDLGRAKELLNRVRQRVGLGEVEATLDNIYKERRFELAFEGQRWYDLIRTGQAPTVLAFKGFVAGKHEHLPIPLDELSNTKLVQNPGYN